jgi:hypothetical protein
MLRITALSVLLFAPIGSDALAQNPKVNKPSATAAAKFHRCDNEGRAMGLSNKKSESAAGLRQYIVGCMKG